ncbi:YceI family protein [Cellulomonas bogoriensis]|uniref:Lipid/polyisoprenoid-binding YceI-like domain-containing protein n=1 Tax=Cellulomonas bogoriensis 69B4 = DSM 16987 TaxID=1386082 RepID=A0A0A0BYV7_9CELL|nr:YceI family protein [Cellulomonas bogoriensis]KGM13135.1 hypothetical protein N869_16010 [Cellulomonas bogoriensis 69B4 = DSM 16987]
MFRTLITVVVAATAVVGGPWVYAQYFAPDPVEPVTLSDQETAGVLVEQFEGVEGIWPVLEGSEAGYRVEEVLSGQDVTVVGRTEEVSGELEVVDGELVDAQVVVATASITTDESARDAYFRRALDTSTYPQATFVLAEPVPVGDLDQDSGPVEVEAVGTLTLRDVSRPVTAVLEAQVVGTGVEVVGRVPVVLEQYDLAVPDLGFVTVEPEGTVEFRLVLGR